MMLPVEQRPLLDVCGSYWLVGPWRATGLITKGHNHECEPSGRLRHFWAPSSWVSLLSNKVQQRQHWGAGGNNATTNSTITLPADGILELGMTASPAAGVTVQFANTLNTPVTMLATGDVTINGTIALVEWPGLGLEVGTARQY
ncbi:MAG: hypothetical protein U0231_04540 [Nitrospiraceae bacterium]